MAKLPSEVGWMEICLCVAILTTPISHYCAGDTVSKRQSLVQLFGHSAMHLISPSNIKTEQESEMVLHLLTKGISAVALTGLFCLLLQAHFWSDGHYLLFNAKQPLLKLITFVGTSRQDFRK